MVKVTFKGVLIAESDQTIVVENNHYFPPSSVTTSLFTNSKTRCGPLSHFSRFPVDLISSPFGHTAPSVHGKGLP
jgi:hypothetical protein